jgi:molybdopterin molybdotransferase
MFGQLAGIPMLGLPGNPVSSLVCGLVFLYPAIQAMLGATDDPAATTTAVLGSDLGENDRRQDYLRAKLEPSTDGTPVATPLARQDSSMMSYLATSECLIIRPPHAPAAKQGEKVRILQLQHHPIGI